MAEDKSLTHRTVVGTGWLVLWRVSTRLLGFASTVILARLLVPQDFGLVAIAMAYVAAFDALSLFGLHDALIRTKDPTPELVNTAFTFAFIRGCANAALIAATAPLAAMFFGEPRLIPVLLALSALAFLEGVENIGVVEFRRFLRFDMEFRLFLFPRIFSVITTIVAAIVYRTYWALIAGVFVLRLTRLILTYTMHPVRPRFGLAAWRDILGFSFWTWANGMTNFARDRGWSVVLGRIADTFHVGVFAIATEIALLPITELVHPACRSLFSSFSARQNQGRELGQAYIDAVGLLALVVVPAAVGISATGAYVVALVLGAQWTDAVPVIQIVASAAPFSVLTTIGGIAMVALGRVKGNFVVTLGATVVGISASLILAEEFSVAGVAVALAITIVLESLWLSALVVKELKLRAGSIVMQLWRPLTATAAMASILLTLGYGWSAALSYSISVWYLCLSVVVGALCYGATMFALWYLSGQPDGAERIFISLVRKFIFRSRGEAQT